MTASVAQRDIVAAVADRGYLDGYSLDQRISRQLVKELEEVCEAMQAIMPALEEGRLPALVLQAFRLGQAARDVFDTPLLFDDVSVNSELLIKELPDLVVPLAVLADCLGQPDMMEAGLDKALADVARGVR